MAKINLPTSSAIESLDYNRDLNVLYVYFRPSKKQVNGSVYGYFDVPVEEWTNLTLADSHGKYLNEVIKTANYPYRRVKRPTAK